jgi:hypothetical protein
MDYTTFFHEYRLELNAGMVSWGKKETEHLPVGVKELIGKFLLEGERVWRVPYVQVAGRLMRSSWLKISIGRRRNREDLLRFGRRRDREALLTHRSHEHEVTGGRGLRRNQRRPTPLVHEVYLSIGDVSMNLQKPRFV